MTSRSPIFVAVVLALTTLAGCFPLYTSPAAQQQAYASALGEPSHPATTPAQWSELESRVIQLAQEGFAPATSPARVTNRGFVAEHRFAVKGGHCYRAAVAWAYDAVTHASVTYQARADGQPVNDSVGGARAQLENRSGTLQFCADRDGEALLSLSALGANGAVANNELLEYAVALAEKAESGEEARVRRAQDQAAGTAARQRQDANIAAAKERERRNLAERCKRCREEFRLCQVEAAYARKHPKPGVSYTQSCEQKFGICATGKYSGTPEEMAQCGEPPP